MRVSLKSVECCHKPQHGFGCLGSGCLILAWLIRLRLDMETPSKPSVLCVVVSVTVSVDLF